MDAKEVCNCDGDVATLDVILEASYANLGEADSTLGDTPRSELVLEKALLYPLVTSAAGTLGKEDTVVPLGKTDAIAVCAIKDGFGASRTAGGLARREGIDVPIMAWRGPLGV